MILDKTLELLSLLHKKELSLLEREVLALKNIKTKRLHEFCQQKKVKKLQDNKIAIFKSVFKAVYTEKNDYLLRNEIRLYNEVIKEVIAWFQLKKDKKLFHDAYIQGLQARNANNLAQKELRAAVQISKENMDYTSTTKYLDGLVHLRMANQEYTSKNFLEIREALKQLVEAIHFQTNDKLSETLVKYAYTERVLTQLTAIQSNYDGEALKDTSQFQSSFAKYNFLKAASYNAKVEDRINNLQEMIELLEVVNHPKINRESHLGTSYAALALEYLLETNYAEAVLNFEKSKAYKEYMSEQLWSNVSLNYLSSLCKLGDFEKAKHFCDENQDLQENHVLKTRILPNIIGVYLMNGEIAKAESLLPLNFKDGDIDSYHYFRLLQAFIHYENNLLELAENELINFRKHLYSLEKEKHEFTIDMTQLILSYVTAKYSKLTPDFEKWKINFNKDLAALTDKYGKFDMDSVIIAWLKKKIA